MQAKIIQVNSTGCNVDSENFEIPLVVGYGEFVPNNDGSFSYHEPMLKHMFILEIGTHKYWIKSDGQIEQIV